MPSLADLSGPFIGLSLVVVSLAILLTVATVVASIEHRWSIGAFRRRRPARSAARMSVPSRRPTWSPGHAPRPPRPVG